MSAVTTVSVRGVRLAVRDEGAGRVLVWGHGLLGSMAQDDDAGVFAFPGLAGHARVVRYDARGHGRSGASGKAGHHTWPALAQDMLGVLDAVGAQTAVLGGASMGCATALHAAMAAPERVEGLVLAIPPTAWSGRRRQAAAYRVGAGLVRVAGMAPFVALARAAPVPALFRGELSPVHRVAVDGMAALDAGVVPDILRGAAASDLPPKDTLGRIGAPALILAWEGDPVHPVATARELARRLPQAELHVAGRPADVSSWGERVREFLARS